jgi:hypothetical protein
VWIARVAGAGCSAGSMVIFGRKYGWRGEFKMLQ